MQTQVNIATSVKARYRNNLQTAYCPLVLSSYELVHPLAAVMKDYESKSLYTRHDYSDYGFLFESNQEDYVG
jgi:hypothetical protein